MGHHFSRYMKGVPFLAYKVYIIGVQGWTLGCGLPVKKT